MEGNLLGSLSLITHEVFEGNPASVEVNKDFISKEKILIIDINY